MTRPFPLLLLLSLIAFLALPPGVLSNYGKGIGGLAVASGLASPQDTGQGSAGPGFEDGKKSDRRGKQRDRRERKRDRQDRQRPVLTPEQVRIEALVEDAPPKTPALATENPCGPGLIQLPRSGRCTHGPDPEPPAAARSAARSLEPEVPAALCDDGDGTAGFRVQVLYLRATSAPNNYESSLSAIRGAAEGANAILRDSQPGSQEALNYLFVRDDACEIEVAQVTVSRTAILDFDFSIAALEQQGYDRTDRIYLVFADTGDAGICGIATYWPDDRKIPTNFNNRGPSYARADLGCWDAHTAAHEMMHNLGAVQDSAPNATGFGHCIDEYDVMCYRDDPRAPSMQVRCTPGSVFEIRYDCNNDDYFSPDPAQGSYLDTHWNTADNRFLIQDIPSGTDLTPPKVSWIAPVANGQTYVTSSPAIPLRASATDPSGIEVVEFWLYDENAKDWVSLGEDFTAPYEGNVAASVLRSGLNYLTADAYDTQDNWTDEGIWIEKQIGASTTTIALVTSTTNVKVKKQVMLTAAIGNPPASGASVEFRICRGGACTWEGGQSLGVFSGPSASTSWRASGKGQVTFLAQVMSEAGVVTSNPLTVTVKKVKKKH